MRNLRSTFAVAILGVMLASCSNIKPTIDLSSLSDIAKFILPTSMLTTTENSFLFRWNKSGSYSYKMFDGPFCNGGVVQSSEVNAASINLNLKTGFNSLQIQKGNLTACSPTVMSPGTVALGEINLQPSTSNGFGAYIGGIYYFLAGDDDHGEELWRTDGTTAGTYMVKDIRPGADSSYISTYSPKALVVFQGKLVFSADDGVNGSEMWISDGTTAGTYMAYDLATGNASSNPYEFVATLDGSKLFFRATDTSYDNEPWAWDGISAPVKINVNTLSSSWVDRLTPGVRGGIQYMYMSGETTSNGNELIRIRASDNNVVAFDLVASGSSMPAALTFDTATETLYFKIYDNSVSQYKFFKEYSGGTSYLCPSVIPYSSGNAYDMAILAGDVYFSGDDGTANGHELIKYNGSTCSRIDINPGSAPSYPQSFMAVNDGSVSRILFVAESSSEGTELRTYDGSTLQDLIMDPGPSGVYVDTNAIKLASGRAYFRMTTSAKGYEYYTSDGTLSGTQIVAPEANGTNSGSQNSLAVDGSGNLMFVNQNDDKPSAVYKWLASSRTLSQGIPVTQKTMGATIYGEGLEVDRKVYFVSELNGNRQIFESDASSTGTKALTNFTSMSGPHLAYYMAGDKKILGLLNSEIYFGIEYYDGTYNRAQIWKLNPKTKAISVVHDLGITMGSASIKNFYTSGDKLYFSAWTQNEGHELWRTDGTAAGTIVFNVMAADGSGLNIGWPTFAEFQGKFYFAATDTGGTGKLFRVSNNSSTLEIVKTTTYPSADDVIGDPKYLTVSGNKLYFSATNANEGTYPALVTNGEELFAVDGATGMASVVRNINPSWGSAPQSLTAFNGKLLFSADDSTNGRELWISDGTFMGTTLLKDLAIGSSSGFMGSTEIVVYGNRAFFSAQDASYDNEPYVSDGTPAGTIVFSNINSSMSSYPSNFRVVGDKLIYMARDNMTDELWVYDGSSNMKASARYPNYKHPMTTMGGNFSFVFQATQSLFYTANSALRGTEMHIFIP